MTGLDRQIRARRRAKNGVDPWRPLGALPELERQAGGSVEPGLTLFLAGAECPFTCVFCDLWRETLDTPTPQGALPRQIERGVGEGDPSWRWVKLYNASNFFDPRAVPPQDHEPIARAVDRFPRVVVESHPRLLGDGSRRFAERLLGRLEVAVGLETVHPEALPRLNKKMTLGLLDAAVGGLAADGIAWRAFVLLGTPFIAAREQLRWTVASVGHALERGASSVSIIPVRPTAELRRLEPSGEFTPPTLALAEAALEGSLALEQGGGVVRIDLWGLEGLSSGCLCEPPRLRRLERMSLNGETEPGITCGRCAAGEKI